MWPGILKLRKVTSLLFLHNTLRKKWVANLIFYMQMCMKVSWKLILGFLMGMVKISKVPKMVSLQCLCNISRKKLEIVFIFYMQMDIKVSASWHYRFWWKWPDMAKVSNVLTLWCKIFRYFMGSSHVCCLFFSFFLFCFCFKSYIQN